MISSSSPTKEIQHIALIIAMQQEAAPLLERFQLSKVDPKLLKHVPCEMYSGVYKNGLDEKDYTISIVTLGTDKSFGVSNVGTAPATVAGFVAVNELNPDIVLSVGTAGGFKRKGAEIGDPFISTFHTHHDRRIPIPGFKEYGIGKRSAISCSNLIKNLGLKSGVVTSGNSLDHTPMDDIIMEENDASIKEMEAASIAWILEYSATPFICVKVVTDIVDGGITTQEEFMANLSTASKSLQTIVPKILDNVFGKHVEDL